MSMIDGMMQIAVFTETRRCLHPPDLSGRGASRICSICRRRTEAITQPRRAAIPAGFGQTVFNSTTNNVGQEICRDLRHMEDSIASSILTAETDWIQGGDLYTDTSMSAEDGFVGSMNVMAGLESRRTGGPDSLITAPSGYCTGSGATHPNQIVIGPGLHVCHRIQRLPQSSERACHG